MTHLWWYRGRRGEKKKTQKKTANPRKMNSRPGSKSIRAKLAPRSHPPSTQAHFWLEETVYSPGYCMSYIYIYINWYIEWHIWFIYDPNILVYLLGSSILKSLKSTMFHHLDRVFPGKFSSSPRHGAELSDSEGMPFTLSFFLRRGKLPSGELT